MSEKNNKNGTRIRRGIRRGRQRAQTDWLKIATALELAAVCICVCLSAPGKVEPPKKEEQVIAVETATPLPPEPTPTPEPQWVKHISPYSEDYVPLLMTWHYRPRTLEAMPSGIDAICPTWLYVEADDTGRAKLTELGSIENYEDWQPEQYVKKAHEGGAEVWVCVVSFDPELSRQVVEDAAVKAEFIAGVKAFCEKYNIDGVNFDFEKMDPQNKANFTALVQETKREMGQESIVSVCVTVPLGYDAPKNWYQCYDRAALSEVCDYVAVMAYDASTTPSAPTDWLEKHLRYTLEEVPSHKLIMALPFYGSQYIYSDGQDKPTKRNYTPKLLASLLQSDGFYQNNTQYTVAQWHVKAKYIALWDVYEYSFTDTQGNRHDIYMDSADTILKKAEMVPQYCLAGGAVWQFVFGNDELWSAMRVGVNAKIKPLE